jgi:nitrogen fixation NifU-like protein
MYSAKLLDHFHNPCNVGDIDEPSATVEVTNPVCGDVMKLSAAVSSDMIVDAKFKVAGCVPAVACGSWLTTAIVGKSLSSLHPILASEIESALEGLPPASKHASALAAQALRLLLERLRTQNVESGKSKFETGK